MRWIVVFAYLDPGTGSYLFQLGLAGALGAAYAMKQVWSQLSQYTRRLFIRESPDDER